MQEEKQEEFFSDQDFRNEEDKEDLDYHWQRVKHFAGRLESAGYSISVGGLVNLTTTDLKVEQDGMAISLSG